MIEHRGISTPGFPAPPALTSAAEFLRVANYATSQMRSKVREGGTALRFVHTKCYRQFEFGKLSEREVVAIVLVHWRQDGDADRQSVVVSPKGKHSGDQTSRHFHLGCHIFRKAVYIAYRTYSAAKSPAHKWCF